MSPVNFLLASLLNVDLAKKSDNLSKNFEKYVIFEFSSNTFW